MGEWSEEKKQGTWLRIQFHTLETLKALKRHRKEQLQQAGVAVNNRVRKINPVPVTAKYNVNKQILQLQFDLIHTTQDNSVLPE